MGLNDVDIPIMVEIEDGYSPKHFGANEVQVHGRIVRGMLDIGMVVDIVGILPQVKRAKVMDIAKMGKGHSFILKGVSRQDIYRGQVLVLPGTVEPKTTFLSLLYIKREERDYALSETIPVVSLALYLIVIATRVDPHLHRTYISAISTASRCCVSVWRCRVLTMAAHYTPSQCGITPYHDMDALRQ